ncbi:DUF6090 family protein [Aegicerativicinus sediminis]
MIKLFRNMRKGLISDKNFGRYLLYAFGEIVLVVIGILIALSINNWNENRKRKNKEIYYLNSVKTSIDLSQKEFNRVINDAEEIHSSADTLIVLLATNSTNKLRNKTLDSLMYNSGNYSIMSLNDAGIKEILNTGSLDIIQDEGIRIILASWDERIHEIRKFENETENLARNYDKYIMDFIDLSRFFTDSLQGIVIPDKRNDLISDPVFRNHLGKISFAHAKMHNMYTEEKQFLDSLDILIDYYLDKNP